MREENGRDTGNTFAGGQSELGARHGHQWTKDQVMRCGAGRLVKPTMWMAVAVALLGQLGWPIVGCEGAEMLVVRLVVMVMRQPVRQNGRGVGSANGECQPSRNEVPDASMRHYR